MSTPSPSPFVSTRISIAWPPLPASEPTDTLVLTGRTRRFIDLRVYKEGTERGKIQWATAGEKVDLGEGRALFTNEIDFRFPAEAGRKPPPSTDIGKFVDLPNGEQLETGEMSNPDAGGKVQPYEEIWRDYPLADNEKGCIMLAQESQGLGRGYLARIGRWELGIRDSEGRFVAVRYDKDKEGCWKRIYYVNEGKEEEAVGLPRIPENGIGVAKVGDVVSLGGLDWTVQENS